MGMNLKGERISLVDFVEQHQNDHAICADIQIMFSCFKSRSHIGITLTSANVNMKNYHATMPAELTSGMSVEVKLSKAIFGRLHNRWIYSLAKSPLRR